MKQEAKISLKDIAIDCVLGVGEQERSTKQTVLVAVDIVCDAVKAIKSDAIEDTINYSDLSKKISLLVSQSQFHLFETLASEVLTVCLEDPRVLQATVRITKPVKGAVIEMIKKNMNKKNFY